VASVLAHHERRQTWTVGCRSVSDLDAAPLSAALIFSRTTNKSTRSGVDGADDERRESDVSPRVHARIRTSTQRIRTSSARIRTSSARIRTSSARIRTSSARIRTSTQRIRRALPRRRDVTRRSAGRLVGRRHRVSRDNLVSTQTDSVITDSSQTTRHLVRL